MPNIVVLVLDTAAARHFSLYGYSRPTTPNIEKISRFATVYTRCFSPAPWTLPAHASLFTGLYPGQHLNDGTRLKINRNFYTLPEILRKSGYYTCGISTNTIITHEFCHGFEAFYESFHLFKETKLMKEIKIDYFMRTTPFRALPYIESKHDITEQMISLPIKQPSAAEKIKLGAITFAKSIRKPNRFVGFTKVLLNFANGKRNNVVYDATPSTLRAFKIAAKQLRKLAGTKEPFFLFVNFMQLHDRYNPPADTRDSFVKENKEYESVTYDMLDHYAIAPFPKRFLDYLEARYDEELLFLDRIVMKIDELLHELNLADSTMLVITSDHGEAFGKHGHVQHLFSTYNELTHIPLVIRYPKGSKSAGANDNLVQLHDLFATINEVANTPFPCPQSSVSLLGSQKRCTAVSQLLDVEHKLVACKIKNKQFDIDHFEFKSPEISVITDNMHKLIQRGGHYECYDLQKGFYETESIDSQKNSKTFEALMSLLEQVKCHTGYNEAVTYEQVNS